MALAHRPRPPGPRTGPPAPFDPLRGPDPDDSAVLDAYSAAVSAVAESLAPSVASLRIERSMGGRYVGAGSGSAVAFTPDGFLVTSAHVVAGTERGAAAFVDGSRHLVLKAPHPSPLSAHNGFFGCRHFS